MFNSFPNNILREGSDQKKKDSSVFENEIVFLKEENKKQNETILSISNFIEEKKRKKEFFFQEIKIEQSESSQLSVVKDKNKYILTYLGQPSDFWINSTEIPKNGVYGIKVIPLQTNPSDSYFGFGVLQKTFTQRSKYSFFYFIFYLFILTFFFATSYLCYSHIKGKFIDVRNGSLCGSGDEQVINFFIFIVILQFLFEKNVQSGWSRCCNSNSEITVKVDNNKKQIIFLLNGSNQFWRNFTSSDDSYVFVFDPYYKNTKFSVEFFKEI